MGVGARLCVLPRISILRTRVNKGGMEEIIAVSSLSLHFKVRSSKGKIVDILEKSTSDR